ncbi:MAG: hypothetical protein NXI22_00445 [bacterium]|nr:hypothetical protein [bacterium]
MLRTLASLALVAILAQPGIAEEDPLDKLNRTTSILTGKDYDLQYKFTPGETVRWKVTHLATTETKIRNTTQTSKSRSVSTKVWRIGAVKDGEIQFVNLLDDVDMWSKIGDEEEIRYNSRTDETPPPGYENVASSIGTPRASVTIDSAGTVIERKSNSRETNFGLGEIVMPLPGKPVKIGYRWFAPGEVTVRLPNEQVQRVKTRKAYTLKSVEGDIALIDLKTEVLTPVHSAQVKSQLVQQITAGEIKFDMKAGRLRSKNVTWDETVIGFQDPDSIMQYLAKFTEELVSDEPEARAASKPIGPSPQ